MNLITKIVLLLILAFLENSGKREFNIISANGLEVWQQGRKICSHRVTHVYLNM